MPARSEPPTNANIEELKHHVSRCNDTRSEQRPNNPIIQPSDSCSIQRFNPTVQSNGPIHPLEQSNPTVQSNYRSQQFHGPTPRSIAPGGGGEGKEERCCQPLSTVVFRSHFVRESIPGTSRGWSFLLLQHRRRRR